MLSDDSKKYFWVSERSSEAGQMGNAALARQQP